MSNDARQPHISERFARNMVNGWIPSPQHAAAFAARNPTARFCNINGGALMNAQPRDIFLPQYLLKACRETYGKDWRWKPQYQKHGTCVGQSHKTGTDITMGVNRFISGIKFEGRAAVAPIYAGSRVEIGGWVGRGDGSNGSWAAEWLTKYGVVLLKELNLPEDSTDTDEDMARAWTARSEGVPAQYEAIAKTKPIKNAAQVKTPEEVRAALWGLNYVNICTNLIPGSQRSADGTSRMSNQGGHSTGIVGCRQTGSGWVYAYLQSWGDWARGFYPWTKFDPFNEFACAIVDISESDLSRVLREQDSYALSGVSGFNLIDPDYFF